MYQNQTEVADLRARLRVLQADNQRLRRMHVDMVRDLNKMRLIITGLSGRIRDMIQERISK